MQERPMTGRAALMDRDPMLMHAVAAHGGEWRPDLQATTNYAMAQDNGLPEIRIETTRHQMAWNTPDGMVRRNQEWLNGPYRAKAEWHATATIPDRWPETVLSDLTGRPLSDVVDLAGAEAWTIDAVARVPGFHVDLVLRRR